MTTSTWKFTTEERERLSTLAEGETMTVYGRCPVPRCTHRESLEVVSGLWFLPEDNRYGNRNTHPLHPSTEGRSWVGILAVLGNPNGYVYDNQPRCPEHGDFLAWRGTEREPERAPRRHVERRPAQRLNLPKIVEFLGVKDSGEYGNANCPHCGALGRYVYSFRCDDGKVHGAMAGCIRLFPVSPLAEEHRAIMERRREREETGRTLASWDVAKLEALEAFYAGTGTEADVLGIIQRENARRSDWLRRNRRGR